MGAPRRKNLMARRRRTHDDDGEDDGSLAAGLDDDSSQASLPSDLDDDADGEGSDTSDQPPPRKNGVHKANAADADTARATDNGVAMDAAATKPSPFAAAVADTEAMLNGMNISAADGPIEEMDFDEADSSASRANAGRHETLAERRRREHEEYKKRRDADPAFVPNRGGFFMHDQRSSPTGQNGFRPSMRGGRGRGRGFGGPFSPLGAPHNSSSPANALWAHDLHETVVDDGDARSAEPSKGTTATSSRPPVPPQTQPPPNRSFSKTTQIGNVQLRVLLAGMEGPKLFSAVPVFQYTRLPHHRPPLRRDKPVRISLPNNPPRYIFPAVDRSFIFIPRALRPNQQQMFPRGRGRGSFGYGSGRGSAYGGSTYSPSIAMSRRSSIVRDVGREAMVSPAGSVMSRNRSVVMEGGRPVVRLPPSADPNMPMGPPMSTPLFPSQPAPIVNLPMASAAYAHLQPQPQDPISHESLPPSLPMHQPRPQKAVSVAGIEAPEEATAQQIQNAELQQHQAPQLQPQPFHQQMPMAMNGQGYPSDPNLYTHSRRPSHPSQGGTPLSQIPERAIHAQPFHPYPYQPSHSFYPQHYGPVYYYPPAAHSMPHTMGAPPPFIPGQQYPYMGPAASTGDNSNAGGGTVAHESNGMVYYYDPSQLQVPTEDAPHYPPMGYPSAGGYMMPSPAVYYPSQ